MKRIVLLTMAAALAVTAAFGQERGASRVAKDTLGEQIAVSVGKQYALFIAIDKYREWNALRKPVADAMEIRDILVEQYFIDEVLELYDAQATRANIVKTFAQLQGKLGVNDSLFVYYAGHGHLDKGSKTGFWIPVDGGIDQYEQANWLPNAVIRGYISGFKTIHVFLVSDACFSGDILNEHRGQAPAINTDYYRRAYKLTSREVLTSGSSETVPDESEFSSALKMCLRKNNEPLLDPMSIYNDVKKAVRKTTPLYGTLSAAQHQDGAAFLFFRKGKETTAKTPSDTMGGANSTMRKSVATGNLFVTTVEAGRLRISGNGVDKNENLVKWGECSLEKTPAGDYTLTMTYSDGKVETKTVEVGRNTTGAVEFTYRLAAKPAVAPSKLPTLNNKPGGKAEEAYNRGLKYSDNGDYDRALAEYAEAIRLNPGYALAYDSRAYIHNNRGAYDLAIADCTEAVRLDPKYATAYVRRGFAYDKKGAYDLAIADYTEAVRLDPKYALAYNNRSSAYRMKGQYDQAIADCTEAIRLDPKYAMAYYNRGDAYRMKGQYDRAIADCTEAIRLDHKYASVYYSRGDAYRMKGQYDQAIADCTEAIRLNPKYAFAYYNRGDAYRMKGQYDLAITDCTEAIRLDSKYAFAYGTRGAAYRGKGQYDQAIADCTESIRLNPTYALAYYNRGDAYRMKGQYDQAIADCTEAIRLDHKYASVYYSRGDAYRMKGQYDQAIADCTEAIRLDPKYAWAYGTRGEAYRMKGQYDQAIADCTETIRLNPKYAFAYGTRGAAYRMKGQYDQAITDCTEAIKLNPKYAWAYDARGRAYEAKGDTKRADADFAEAKRLGL